MKNQSSTSHRSLLIYKLASNHRRKLSISIMFLLYAFIPLALLGQSDVWQLGNRIIGTGTASCQQSTGQNMLGFIFANYSFNSQQDNTGAISFFTFAGEVYDVNGDLHGTINEPFYNTQFNGYPEIVIIPVPGSCTRYFIVGAHATNATTTHTDPKPLYAEYDLMMPNAVTGTLGSLVNATNNIVTATQIANSANGTWVTPSVHGSDMHFAVTTERSDGTRILFIQTSGAVYASLVTNTGIGQAVNISPVAIGGSSSVKAEMEVYESGPNSNRVYRLAMPLGSGGNNNYVQLLSLDHQLNVIPGSLVNIGPFLSTSSLCWLKGLEFSPNGQYLYTMNTGSDYLRCFNSVTGAAVSLNVSQAALAPFQNSMLEMGKDGSIYYVNSQSGLNTDLNHIISANTPGSASLASVCSFPSHFATGLPGFNSGIAGYLTIDVLPDQIDQENYIAVNTSRSCCLERMIYEADNYSFQGNAIWTASSNPFNSSGSPIKIKS